MKHPDFCGTFFGKGTLGCVDNKGTNCGAGMSTCNCVLNYHRYRDDKGMWDERSKYGYRSDPSFDLYWAKLWAEYAS